MKLCDGTYEIARPAFITRGFCPVCKLAVYLRPDGSTKRHYAATGLRVGLGPREGFHHRPKVHAPPLW